VPGGIEINVIFHAFLDSKSFIRQQI
jgi:hypothetical protein